MSRPSSESRLEVESDSPQTLTAKSCLGHLALTSCLFDWLSGWMTEEIPSALRHLNSPPSHMPQSIFSLSEAFSIKMKRGSASSALHCRSPLTNYLQGQKFRTYSAFDKVKSKQDQTAWEHRCVIFFLFADLIMTLCSLLVLVYAYICIFDRMLSYSFRGTV